MPPVPLTQRVDRTSITATLLALPKGKKRARGVGFFGGNPVANVQSTGNSTPPFHWIDGKPTLITFQEAKQLVASGGSSSQLTGCWYTPKHDEHAVVWTRRADGGVSGTDLHPAKWQKSNAIACGDGQQLGYGYEKFAKDPSKALLWSGSRDSLVVLTGPDVTVDTSGNGVAQGVQVGGIGGGRWRHACLWRGTSASFVDLHPSDEAITGSEALGAGDSQQVGHVWDQSSLQRAALWSGSGNSYVNLAPAGFVRSTAWRCARGLQVGWAAEKEMGMLVRAILWGGDASDFIDLQQFVPEPWNVSQAFDLDVDGDTLRILGNAQQAQMQGKYEVNAGEQPLMWEMKLLVAEPPARRELAPAVTTSTDEEVSDEQRMERAVAAFARGMIDDDYEAAHAVLAPWLQKHVAPSRLREILVRQFLADSKAVDFHLTGNDSTLDELREHYAEYHKNDAARTLASAESFGDWGPPSIYVADEITKENFRQWMMLELTPELDDESGLDYLLKLYLIVVDVAGEMKIGHLEPET